MKKYFLIVLILIDTYYNVSGSTLFDSSFNKKKIKSGIHTIITDPNKISYGWLKSPYWKNPVVALSNRGRKTRTIGVAAINITMYASAFAGLYTFWYSDYPQSSFHYYNDNAENLQVDKVSHAFGAYIEGRMSIEMWRWGGVSNRKAVLIGGLSGLAYEAVIETFDGFSKEWGWSWGDIGANVFGTTLLLSQELGWHEQRICMKYSTHINDYHEYSPDLRARADKLFGTAFFNRLLEDYNAQTYWLSFNLKSFAKNSNLPAWLNVSVGYGADGMFGSLFNFPEAGQLQRNRQWYLAPDIDFTRIKTKSKVIKYALVALNCLKFPTPSLELSKGNLQWNLITF